MADVLQDGSEVVGFKIREKHKILIPTLFLATFTF